MTTNVFQQYPHFINSDPRIVRDRPYKITPDFMEARHSCFFNGIDLTDKTVLDLGCCVAGSGAWVLSNNARHYTGVEYHKNLADIAITNLNKSFTSDRWTIENKSIEDFLPLSTRYDIIIASGVLYGFFDPIVFLKKLTEISDCIIIESIHPQTNAFNLEKEEFILFKKQHMMWGDTSHNLDFNSSQCSIGFVRHYMNILGYKEIGNLNNLLMNKIPEVYSVIKGQRYAAIFLRTHEELSQGFSSAATLLPADVKIKEWK